MGINFHRIVHVYIIRISQILNIGNSDFGFVSYFEFRASNFWVFSPRIGRTYPDPPPEAVGLNTINERAGFEGVLENLSFDDSIGDTLGFQLFLLCLGPFLRVKSPDKKTVLPTIVRYHVRGKTKS